jgi:hypothetical protein
MVVLLLLPVLSWLAGSATTTSSPWIKTVHIVSMTHLDIGGWGPNEPDCENSCRYSADVCNSYIDKYIPAAVATADELKAMRDKISPPPPPGAGKCWPGHAHSHAPRDWDCPGYKAGFNSTECEAVGCCTDAQLYPTRSSGWCYPVHQPPPPPGPSCPPHMLGDCLSYRSGMEAKDCEAVGCCVNPERYKNMSKHPDDPKSWSGWCFPNQTKPPAQQLNTSFIYHTHPWIVQEYLNATAGCGRGLSSRNATQVAAVEAAVRAGDIAWHAKPFTMIHELCDADLLQWSLNIR